MDILALDFDGVICDSAGETGSTGWKGAQRLWPEAFRGEVPKQILDDFRRVRPVLETGYESILLVRLLRDGHSADEICGEAQMLIEHLVEAEGLTRKELVAVFGSVRDDWIGSDLASWLAAHEFYRGTIEPLNKSRLLSYIITTKEKRFVVALCEAAGLCIPEDRVFGLESGKKSMVLADLSRRHPEATFHFIEDRLPTLRSVAAGANFSLRLYFADWGYNTFRERDSAETSPDIHVLGLSDFSTFATAPGLISS